MYSEYVSGTKDVAFPFDSLVLEPSSEWNRANVYFSKEDMKDRRVPCIIVVPAEVRGESWLERFTDWVGADGVKKIYFGDPVEVLDNG